MNRTTAAALAGLLLTAPLAAPATAQVPNVQQLLQGLLSGNQGQDQALREAFDRGYQRGREDEARFQADRDRRERVGQDRRRPRRDDADEFEGDRGGDRRPYRDERPIPPPPGQRGGPYYNR